MTARLSSTAGPLRPPTAAQARQHVPASPRTPPQLITGHLMCGAARVRPHHARGHQPSSTTKVTVRRRGTHGDKMAGQLS